MDIIPQHLIKEPFGRDQYGTQILKFQLLPHLQRDDLLKDAIESVLAQSFTDFEYIIVDDGCSDDTKALVEDSMIIVSFT